jgi:hypothetical protein
LTFDILFLRGILLANPNGRNEVGFWYLFL